MSKYKKLLLSILFDILGSLSYFIPGIGEFADVIWAPCSGWLMTKLYKGRAGKIAAVFNVVEEALPSIDIIPSFTIMWVYTYGFKSPKK